jgi:hypothetical protein
MAVAMSSPAGAGQAIAPAQPQALFLARVESAVRGGIAHEYAVAKDGQRFLLNSYAEVTRSPITLLVRGRAP